MLLSIIVTFFLAVRAQLTFLSFYYFVSAPCGSEGQICCGPDGCFLNLDCSIENVCVPAVPRSFPTPVPTHRPTSFPTRLPTPRPTPTPAPTSPRDYEVVANSPGCGRFTSIASLANVVNLSGFDGFVDYTLPTAFRLFGNTPLTSIRIYADGCIGIAPNNTALNMWASGNFSGDPIAVGGPTGGSNRDTIPRICAAHNDYDPRNSATDGVFVLNNAGISLTISWETTFFNSFLTDTIQAQLVLYYNSGNFDIRWGTIAPDVAGNNYRISAGIDYDVAPNPRAIPAVGDKFGLDGITTDANQAGMPQNECNQFTVISLPTPAPTRRPTPAPTPPPTPVRYYQAVANVGCTPFASIKSLANVVNLSPTDRYADYTLPTAFRLFGNTPLTSIRIYADGCIGIAPVNTAEEIRASQNVGDPIAVGGSTGRDRIPRICAAHNDYSPLSSATDGVFVQNIPGVSLTISWESSFSSGSDGTDTIQAQLILTYISGNFSIRWGTIAPIDAANAKISAGIDYDVAPNPRATPAVGTKFGPSGITINPDQAGMPQNECNRFAVVIPP
jgi:hypothetical protein